MQSNLDTITRARIHAKDFARPPVKRMASLRQLFRTTTRK